MSEEILPAPWYHRADERDDREFYAMPRMVAHIDDDAIAATRALYAEILPPQADVLDLMSSRYSHLPEPRERYVHRVVGLGMNAAEMAANPQLDEYLVHDLNRDPRLPFPDATFDAVLCAVSIQYLQQPVAVFADVARVLRPGGLAAITFSNRCFPTKAVAAWLQSTDEQHLTLVHDYLAASGFTDIIGTLRTPHGGDPLYAVTARTPA
jgi:SAM-dependent methyltransferase